MAVSPVINNCVQVRLLLVVANQGAVNVLNALTTGNVTVDQTLANTVGAAIKTAWTNNLAALMPASSSLVRVGVRDLRVANSAEFLDGGAAVVGTAVGDALPAQDALVMTLRTAKSGKSFRGRTYIGGFGEGQNGPNGTAAQTAADGAVAFMTGVQNALVAAAMKLGVASRPAERKTIVETTFHNDGTSTVRTISQTTAKSGGIEAVTLVQARDLRWDTQRRRNNGRFSAPTFAVASQSAAFT